MSTTRIVADWPAHVPEPDIEPGTLFIVAHIDHNNRVVSFEPASAHGFSWHMPGRSVVDAAQRYGYLADSQTGAVSDDGATATDMHDTSHTVISRHLHEQARHD